MVAQGGNRKMRGECAERVGEEGKGSKDGKTPRDTCPASGVGQRQPCDITTGRSDPMLATVHIFREANSEKFFGV